MTDQISLFHSVATEEDVYEILLPDLVEGLKKSNAGYTDGREYLKLKPGKSYSSVNYLKYDPYEAGKQEGEVLAFRICLRKNNHFFGVSNQNLKEIRENLLPHAIVSRTNDGFTNFDFERTESGIKCFSKLLVSVLDAITYDITKEFDCCSRIDQCSDARHCIHPNPAMATSCGYRKVLRDGKNYYA